ncbi:MAG: NAD(+) kinase [Armatimonadetes bacterium JP3_11]|jgi:NAD+ kinase|nr:MAG: NAD(+) kinase [Armatimonadetes bacterium CP1_7O]OYT74847.1 MAG: NAD(+) kinase [Armatimonadetes bacterium JP3_11]RMH08525.1 MAG: NAD(+)/NADH kinase [Armatimonadota bacterium]
MATVLIVYNACKPEAARRAQETAQWLQAAGYGVVLADQPTASRWSQPPDPNLALVITLGGDGTLLTGAAIAAPAGVPLLGVHMGRFGFIAQVVPDQLIDALQRWQSGDYQVQERLMAQARVEGEVRVSFALNEITLLRTPTAPMLNFTIRVNDLLLTTYPADGSLVATPTGSTAYALSVGAPVVHPQAEVLILAPISPHTLGARPLVLPPNARISIEIRCEATNEPNAQAIMTTDGRRHQTLGMGQIVHITTAPFRTKLLSFNEGEFFEKLRDRLLWGARVNE